MATALTTTRPPLPPFTRESAIQKVRLAEDSCNTRDPGKVALAYAIDGIMETGPETFFDQGIAMANAAGFNLHAHLTSARLRNVAFHQFPIAAGFAYLRRLHCCAHDCFSLFMN